MNAIVQQDPLWMDTEKWEVEKIVEKRLWNGKCQYLVKWLGWGPSFSTWEMRDGLLEDCPEFVRAFENNKESSHLLQNSSTKPEIIVLDDT